METAGVCFKITIYARCHMKEGGLSDAKKVGSLGICHSNTLPSPDLTTLIWLVGAKHQMGKLEEANLSAGSLHSENLMNADNNANWTPLQWQDLRTAMMFLKI